VLRLLGATLVLFSHSFALTRGSDPVTWLNGETLGTVGVSLFFGISGFLVARSWLGTPQLGVYGAKRALRLLPALYVVVLLSALVLGPLYTTLSLGDYFTSSGTYTYALKTLGLYTVGGHLPGVFGHNLVAGPVNGSLWTLPIEAACYVGVALLGVLGLLRRRPWAPLLVFLALWIAMSPRIPTTELGKSGQGTLDGAELLTGIRLAAIFFGGVLLYLHRDRVRLRWDWLAVIVAVFLACSRTNWVPFLAVLVFPYLVLVLAYRTPPSWRRITATGDVSYGLYLYAFPVQQALVASLGAGLGPLAMFALAFPITYLLALGSWWLVERPALARKPKRGTFITPETRMTKPSDGRPPLEGV
jgi:peptidoglycan/LPS O-acetylase OafA/YrhL